MSTPPPPPSLACLGLLFPALSRAQSVWYYCNHGNQSTQTASATISLADDAPLNQPVGNWITVNHPSIFCAEENDTATNLSVPLHATMPTGTSMSSTYTEGGTTYRIFKPVNQPNIGYIVRARIQGDITSGWGRPTTPGSTNITQASGEIDFYFHTNIQVQIRMIKTSAFWPTNGATVNFAAIISSIQIPADTSHTFTGRANVNFQVSTPQPPTTCTTPSLAGSGNIVPLGNDIAYANFTGPGTATSSVPFTLRVQCNAGSSPTVRYRFLACTTCNTPPNNSTLPMGTGATASGIGVQILNNNSTPLAFNINFNLTGYAPNTGNKQYNIPLRARVIQTCTCPNGQPNCHNHHNCVVPGTVRASMIMQMFIQ